MAANTAPGASVTAFRCGVTINRLSRGMPEPRPPSSSHFHPDRCASFLKIRHASAARRNSAASLSLGPASAYGHEGGGEAAGVLRRDEPDHHVRTRLIAGGVVGIHD